MFNNNILFIYPSRTTETFSLQVLQLLTPTLLGDFFGIYPIWELVSMFLLDVLEVDRKE